MWFALVVVVLLLLAFAAGQEGFRSCAGDGCALTMSPMGTLRLNPFVLPYSGTQCVDDLYIANVDSGLKFDDRGAKMYHLNTPDHVELMGYGSV